MPTAARIYPHWPRLMPEPMAASYLGMSSTSLREHGPKPKRVGRRIMYDIRDLDRWADRLDDQPLDTTAAAKEAEEIERRFLEKRRSAH